MKTTEGYNAMHTHISTEKLSLALDSQLAAAEQATMQEHLAQCGACRQHWETWQTIAHRLQQSPMIGPAPGFVQRFEQRLQRRQAARRGLLGGIVLLTGSISLWSFLALIALLLGFSWLGANPAWAGALVDWAVRAAQTLQPLTVAVRLFFGGLSQIPLPALSVICGGAMLLITFAWAHMVHRRLDQLAPLPSLGA